MLFVLIFFTPQLICGISDNLWLNYPLWNAFLSFFTFLADGLYLIL